MGEIRFRFVNTMHPYHIAYARDNSINFLSNVVNNALVQLSKEKAKHNKTRLRLERQEYPKKNWADAIEEKIE